jgi:23S rRNA pseudouridine2605 synthase
VGCPVRKLERVAIGPVKLADLRRGHWRDIKPSELKDLKKAVGLIDTGRSPRSKRRPSTENP